MARWRRSRVLRSGAGFVYQRVLMERNCCREFRSPPALVLCLEASSTLVDLINVAIHEAPCVCGPVKRHRQHFVSQPIAVILENSLYDVDHAPPHREGVASGVAQASVDVVVRPSSTASKAPRHSASALSRTHASRANHSCSVRGGDHRTDHRATRTGGTTSAGTRCTGQRWIIGGGGEPASCQ